MSINDFYNTLANSHPILARGECYCQKCGRTEIVNPADALKNGWPKCCELTMHLGAPDNKQAALAAAGATDE